MTTTPIAPLSRRHITAFHEALDAVAREERYLAMPEAPPTDEGTPLRPRQPSRRGGALRGAAGRARPRLVRRETEVAGDDEALWGARHGRRRGHRGQGLGGELLGVTLDAALASGMRRVELTVRADNAPAIALYRQFGFATEGVCRRAMRVGGNYYDTVIMARLA